MQMVKKISVILLLSWGAIILLAPKKELYYLLEHRLKKQGIVLAHESLGEYPFGLNAKKADLYLEGLKLGEIERLSFWTLLFYTQMDLKSFRPSTQIRGLPIPRLRHMRVGYGLWAPGQLSVEAEGDFGVAKGTVDLRERKIRLRLVKVGDIQNIRNFLKKDSKGWRYERKY